MNNIINSYFKNGSYTFSEERRTIYENTRVN